MLKTELAQPGHEDALVQEKEYDKWGNVMKSISYPQAEPTDLRWSETQYDSVGRFPIHAIDQLGHVATSVYDLHRALLLSTTGANGLTASFFYDAFGAKILTRNPDGTETVEITAFANCSAPL